MLQSGRPPPLRASADLGGPVLGVKQASREKVVERKLRDGEVQRAQRVVAEASIDERRKYDLQMALQKKQSVLEFKSGVISAREKHLVSFVFRCCCCCCCWWSLIGWVMLTVVAQSGLR